MASPVPQIPLKSPIASPSGLINNQWANWLVTLYKRVGGGTAQTNVELADSQTSGIAALQEDIVDLTVVINDQNDTISAIQARVNDLEGAPLP